MFEEVDEPRLMFFWTVAIATVIPSERDAADAGRRTTIFVSLACLVLSRHVHNNLSAHVHLEIRKPLANHPRHR